MVASMGKMYDWVRRGLCKAGLLCCCQSHSLNSRSPRWEQWENQMKLDAHYLNLISGIYLSIIVYLCHLRTVNYKLVLTKSIANDWTTKAFAICLYGDWTPRCYSWWPSTIPEGVQGGVRYSVLQEIWWYRSLDSWMFLGTDFMISIFASPHI